MIHTSLRIGLALTAALVAATIAACTRAQLALTTPTTQQPVAAGSGLKVSAPSLVSPIGGLEIQGRRPTLVINNARPDHSIQARLMYRFEITDLTTGDVVHDSGLVAEGAGTTSHEVPGDLDEGRAFQWRARAEVPAVGNGPWSETKTFDTPAPPPPPPPPASEPKPALCIASTPLEVVQCARARYGFMGPSELVEFLRTIAAGLNASGIPGGPYGILVKLGGHNCGGYSCDVICAGQGSRQRQFDVLIDGDGAQIPAWGEIPQIRADVCEIVE